jgi:hypothetical protein
MGLPYYHREEYGMMCDEDGKRTNEREKTKKMNDRGKKETKTVSEIGQRERE